MNENLDPTLDNSSQEERDFDRALRPKGFDEFFGQDSILKNLKVLSELILFCEFIQFFAISSISRTSFKRPLKCVLSGYDIIAFR